MNRICTPCNNVPNKQHNVKYSRKKIAMLISENWVKTMDNMTIEEAYQYLFSLMHQYGTETKLDFRYYGHEGWTSTIETVDNKV